MSCKRSPREAPRTAMLVWRSRPGRRACCSASGKQMIRGLGNQPIGGFKNIVERGEKVVVTINKLR